MSDSDFQVLEGCGVLAAAFILVGFISLFVATAKARSQFRSKGYLRVPSGAAWLRFLLFRQYEAFDDPSTRGFFQASHYCLLGFGLVLLAITLMGGSYVLLGGAETLPSVR